MLRDNQLRVFWMSRIDYEKNTGVKNHFHDDIYQLLYLIDGEGTIQINGEKFDLTPKYGYFIPKKYEHSFYFNGISSTIDFKFDILNTELEELIKHEILPGELYIGESLKMKELFKLSISNLKQDNPIIPYRIDILFKDFLLSNIQKSKNSQGLFSHSMFEIMSDTNDDFPFIGYLMENLQSNITLERISKEFNFHPHYIIELFKKKCKMTPMKFLQHLRVEKSKEYLEFSNLTISEIADQVGLSAPYFSRLFHMQEGMPPIEYREQTRTVIGKDILLEKEFFSSLHKQPKISNYEG